MLPNTRTPVRRRPSERHPPHPLTAPRCVPDLRQLSYDPVRDGLEVLDRHLRVPRQVSAVLHPDDGGLQPVVGDVDGAVELGLVALGQLHDPYGGLKAQLVQLLRGQVGPRNMDRDHDRTGRVTGQPPGRMTCSSETHGHQINKWV